MIQKMADKVWSTVLIWHAQEKYFIFIHIIWFIKYITWYIFFYIFWPCKYVLATWNVSKYCFSTGNEFSHHINIKNEFFIKKNKPFYGFNERVVC